MKSWIYTRRSTGHQSDVSLEIQEEVCRKWATGDISVVNETGSGADRDRPQLNLMLSQLRPGDYVLIYDNSRLSRSLLDSITILKEITDKGAVLICDGKKIDPNNPQDLFTFNVHSAFSDYQRLIQNKKAQEGRQKQYENGDAVFTSSLFGYELLRRGKHVTVNIIEEEARIIRFVFQKYSEGWSTSRLEKELMGTPMPRNHVLDLLAMRRILGRSIYMGYYLKKSKLAKQIQHYNEDEIRPLLVKSNLYPPIVDESLWWACFRGYRKAKYKVRPFETRFSRADLTAVFVCPSCGKGISYLSRYDKYKTPRAVYVLPRHGSGCTMVRKTFYQATWLERMMSICFCLVFLSGGELAVFFKEKENELYENSKEVRDAIDALDKTVSEVDQKISRLVQAVVAGALSLADVKRERESLEKEKETLTGRRGALEEQLAQFTLEAEEWLRVEAREVLDEFRVSPRPLYLRFIKTGKIYPKYLTAEFMNGKTFVIHRPTRGKPDDTLIEVLKDQDFQYSFIVSPDGFKIKDVSSVEESKEWVMNYYAELLHKVSLFLDDDLIVI